MTDMSSNYVRREMLPSKPPPERIAGPILWARKNLFATPGDALMTLLAVLFLAWLLPNIYNFTIGRAVFDGTVEDCRVANVGACWIYIEARITFFIYGFYPAAEYWRVNLVFLMLALLL